MLIEHDEIAVIARVTMALGKGCQDLIDGKIAEALRTRRWDEMNKWHRVRLRIDRLQRQMTGAGPMHFAKARPELCAAAW